MHAKTETKTKIPNRWTTWTVPLSHSAFRAWCSSSCFFLFCRFVFVFWIAVVVLVALMWSSITARSIHSTYQRVMICVSIGKVRTFVRCCCMIASASCEIHFQQNEHNSAEARSYGLNNNFFFFFFVSYFVHTQKVNRFNSTHGHEQLQKRTKEEDNHSNCKCV